MKEPLIDESCLSDAEILTKAPLVCFAHGSWPSFDHSLYALEFCKMSDGDSNLLQAPSPTVDSAYASSEDGTESLPSPLVQKREKRLGSSGLTSSSSHQSLAEITDADTDVFPNTNSKPEETAILFQPQVSMALC